LYDSLHSVEHVSTDGGLDIGIGGWIDSAMRGRGIGIRTGNCTDVKVYSDKGREKADIKVIQYKHMLTCPKTH
jgi:hypothetical protein